MICPRCGRQVSDTANFCGGCGLSKEEILKANSPKPVSDNEVQDINDTISKLEDDLTGVNPSTDYTIGFDNNSNDEGENFVESEMKNEKKVEQNSQDKYSNSYEYTNQANSVNYSSNYSNYNSNNSQYVDVNFSEETRVSTSDFILMSLITSIPFVGLFYLFYLAFIQKKNSTKRSWAMANICMWIFAFIVSLVFFVGVAMNIA